MNLPDRVPNGLTVLDAFCCIGGAGMGYYLAGFDVVGVDIVEQPDYPFTFVQADAVAFIRGNGGDFSFIHASPPCQGEGAPTKGTNRARNEAMGRVHPRLIVPTREALQHVGRPSVIENVAGSTVRKDIRLCGEMFGLPLLMHRYFELGGWSMLQPHHPAHRGRVRGYRHGVNYDGPYIAAYGKGGGKATVEEMRQAKGISWSSDHFLLREALPVQYTRLIGEQIAGQLTAARAAA
jgi:hypothetical protein